MMKAYFWKWAMNILRNFGEFSETKPLNCDIDAKCALNQMRIYMDLRFESNT